MKAKSALFLFAVLLSTAALTGATARADAPTAPATPAVTLSVTPAWAVAPCTANLTSTSLRLTPNEATPPQLTPAQGTPLQMDTLICGSCSTPACRNATYNSVCNVHGATCVAALGTECDFGVPQCQCWSGPFP